MWRLYKENLGALQWQLNGAGKYDRHCDVVKCMSGFRCSFGKSVFEIVDLDFQRMC